MITEIWWGADFPYTSSINGMTSSELAADYLEHCQPELNEAPVTVGYKYANVEILYDILKRAGTLKLEDLNQAAKETDLDTIIGHVSFDAKHVSLMSCVAGQWIRDEDGSYHREIVGNYLIPSVEKTAEIKLLEK